MRNNIAVILLAAGESRRMGKPKLLLPWGDTTVLRKVVNVFAEGVLTDSVAESRRGTDLLTDSVADSRIRTDLLADSDADSRRGTDLLADSDADSRIRTDLLTDSVADSQRKTDLLADSVADSRKGTDFGENVQMGIGDYEIVVVTGGAREQVEGLLAKLARIFPVRTVFNPLYADGGMLSSIQAGLAGLNPRTDAALIGLGDQPQVRVETVQRICAAFRQSGSPLVVPSFQNKRGHPWLAARTLWAEILSMPASTTPRQFINKHAAQVEYVIADESILQDLDTPEDYAHLRP